jgi:hypothetical protein
MSENDEFDVNMAGVTPEPEPEMPEEEFNFVAEASLDPTTIVTIRTNGATPKFVVVDAPTAFSAVFAKAQLYANGQVDLFVDGNVIAWDTPVVGGQTVTVLGNIKGG